MGVALADLAPGRGTEFDSAIAVMVGSPRMRLPVEASSHINSREELFTGLMPSALLSPMAR
jgi:hypothetical protein